ncbi:hypothetical protein BJX63DRAFT_438845, partial [Aspergillus granulosus]
MEIQRLLGQPCSRLGMGDDAELHGSKHEGTSAAKATPRKIRFGKDGNGKRKRDDDGSKLAKKKRTEGEPSTPTPGPKSTEFVTELDKEDGGPSSAVAPPGETAPCGETTPKSSSSTDQDKPRDKCKAKDMDPKAPGRPTEQSLQTPSTNATSAEGGDKAGDGSQSTGDGPDQMVLDRKGDGGDDLAGLWQDSDSDSELPPVDQRILNQQWFKEIGREWDEAAGLRNPKDVIAARTRSSKKDA